MSKSMMKRLITQMTKKSDFDRDSILQHKDFLNNHLYDAKTMEDKRKKHLNKKLTPRELADLIAEWEEEDRQYFERLDD